MFLRFVGLPFFVKMERSLGNGVFLWTQSSFDSSVFMTHMILSHSEEGNQNHRDPVQMRKDKYRLISHPQSKLQIWVKNDKKKNKGFERLTKQGQYSQQLLPCP